MTTSALEEPPDSFAARAASASTPGPLERTLDFGRDAERTGGNAGIVLATALHALVALYGLTSLFELRAFAGLAQDAALARFESTIDITVDEPEPEPEEVPPEPEPEPPKEQLPTDAPEPTEAPAPAAAEAAEILTAPPEEPLNLLDEGTISSTGTRFSGGTTTADGTSKTAVRKVAVSGQGTPGGRGTAPIAAAPPPIDRSEPAGLVLGDDWSSCPFPAEADAEQQNQAVVRLVIVVGPDGRPSQVNVLSDPGYGFGQAARQCALRKRYTPGKDAAGKPVTKSTPPFRVRFQR